MTKRHMLCTSPMPDLIKNHTITTITTKISSDLVINPLTLNILPLAGSKETHNLFQTLNTNSIPKYKI